MPAPARGSSIADVSDCDVTLGIEKFTFSPNQCATHSLHPFQHCKDDSCGVRLSFFQIGCRFKITLERRDHPSLPVRPNRFRRLKHSHNNKHASAVPPIDTTSFALAHHERATN